MSDAGQGARIEALESKLAFAEATVADLNDALVGQQRQIMALESKLERLNERLRSMQQGGAGDDGAQPADYEVPPHY